MAFGSESKSYSSRKNFAKKYVLPDALADQFIAPPDFWQFSFTAIRSRTVLSLLSHIDVNKATGPDGLPARILKELANELAIPITILCRRMLKEACWPERWREHIIAPLYKKGSVYNRAHYRGVHLTSNISKVCERAIGNPLMMFLQDHGFGDSQWAFRKQASSRDLVLVFISQWIQAICGGFKVGTFMGDITAAFDRVDKELLLGKLQSLGVAEVYLDFLNNYLEPRIGRVAVEGALSDTILLCDMVFQGTVLGPALWNTFFHDVSIPARWRGGTDALFADDLAVSKKYPLAVTNDQIMEDMQITRQHVHHWGRRNRVTFDDDKEHLAIIHPLHGSGEPFRSLGCFIDVKLTMEIAIDKIVNQARPKIKAMLRTQGAYSVEDMLTQYKTHIWGITEHHNGAIYHAAASVIARLDRLQQSFLIELRITPEMAFIDSNFAPSELRRDIGMLGFLHKRVLNQCHVGLTTLLPMATRATRWHDKQIDCQLDKCIARHVLWCRSLFGMVGTYNRLPQWVVDMPTVSAFQAQLTQMARSRCLRGNATWKKSFHGCSEMWRTLSLLS